MATIEERADDFCGRLASSFLGFPDILEAGRNGYIVGATEQVAITKQEIIEKACEVYRKELSEIISIFNHIGKELYGINEFGELISLEGSIKDFRKAMEE